MMKRRNMRQPVIAHKILQSQHMLYFHRSREGRREDSVTVLYNLHWKRTFKTANTINFFLKRQYDIRRQQWSRPSIGVLCVFAVYQVIFDCPLLALAVSHSSGFPSSGWITPYSTVAAASQAAQSYFKSQLCTKEKKLLETQGEGRVFGKLLR